MTTFRVSIGGEGLGGRVDAGEGDLGEGDLGSDDHDELGAHLGEAGVHEDCCAEN